jgi:hypothetical protein
VADKTDNGDPFSKIAVRQQAIDWAPKSPAILECYAGEGHMYRAVWKSAAGRHLGMDKRFARKTGDENGECWKGDNAVMIKRAMSLGPWDIIDLDAYANPWPLLRQVLKLHPERNMVALATCTLCRAIEVGYSDFACAVAGANLTYTGLMRRWYDDIVRWAVDWASRGALVQPTECKRLQADNSITGDPPRTYYYAMRFEPIKCQKH